MALGQTKRNYLEQLLTEASTHVLTADFKNKTKKNKETNRRKEKKPSTMKMLSLINSLIKN